MKKIIVTILAIVGMWGTILVQPVMVAQAEGEDEGKKCGGVSTSIIECDSEDKEGGAIFDLLAIVVNIFTFGVGIAATIGLVISGYQYMTARDNPGQIQKAKTRIVEIIIGLAVYALMWGVLNFLLPGGVFGDGS